MPMRFVDVDIDPGRRAATVFFSSDAKVDFRELCRDLCRDPRMRDTLQRLGPHDLAKRAGTCGPCGRPRCCKSFLAAFPSVSVKLVQEQEFPLAPGRSAGMCGRLKCCLGQESGDGACRQVACGGCCSVEGEAWTPRTSLGSPASDRTSFPRAVSSPRLEQPEPAHRGTEWPFLRDGRAETGTPLLARA